jgi:hypothetical protein
MRRRHVPNKTAALQCLYLTIMSLDPTGQEDAVRNQHSMRSP